MTRAISILSLCLGMVACSSSTQKDSEDPSHDDDMAQADALGKEQPLSERRPEDPDSIPPSKGDPQPVGDYEVSQADCQALADQYQVAWEADEFKKTANQKMSDKQRAQIEGNVHRASQDARDNWLSACAGLVGSPYPRDRLDCAMKQKSVKKFDDCWDGKLQPEKNEKEPSE